MLTLRVLDQDEVSFPLRSLLAIQTKLEELKVYAVHPLPCLAAMHSVAQFGAGLKTLEIDADFEQKEVLTRMLEVTGKTLISLELRGMPAGASDDDDDDDAVPLLDVEFIFKLCPHVTNLSLTALCPEDYLLSDQVELLCSYGMQLETIGSCVTLGVPERLRTLRSKRVHFPVTRRTFWAFLGHS